MNKQLVTDIVFSADGSVDVNATMDKAKGVLQGLVERLATDHDSVTVGITTFLMANPALKTVPTTALIRALMNARASTGEFAGDFTKQEEAYKRIEEVVPSYIKANPDQFHTGKKLGVAIRYVPGEVDENGAQKYRHSDEEWAKITAKKAAAQASDDAPESATAKVA